MYLALHQELQEYRAIKQVSREAADYQQFLKEALLLKRLKHPGIPIVYDVFEDEKYSYLVEEFLEGSSLYDLVSQRGPLNQETAILYGIQICDLIHYLHSAEDIPILYLDLQPRNLIVCHGQVKLLDFDHSDTVTGSNEAASRFGTPGYIAPEQRQKGHLDVYTDVYQIGAVLRYLLTGGTEPDDPVPDELGKLAAIIRRCLREDGEERYASALEIGQELRQLCSNTENLSRSQLPPLIIALAGTRSGAGVTHLAIGLAVYLNRAGCPAIYEEHNDSNDVRVMAENLGVLPDSYGIYTLFHLPMRPRYGQAVSLKDCSYPAVVRDYGTDISAASAAVSSREAGLVCLVREGKWWERRLAYPVSSAAGKDFCILYTLAIPGAVKRRGDVSEKGCCYRAPVFADPFQPGEEAEAFYHEIVSRHLALPEGKRRSGLWDCFGRRRIPRRRSRES